MKLVINVLFLSVIYLSFFFVCIFYFLVLWNSMELIYLKTCARFKYSVTCFAVSPKWAADQLFPKESWCESWNSTAQVKDARFPGNAILLNAYKWLAPFDWSMFIHHVYWKNPKCVQSGFCFIFYLLYLAFLWNFFLYKYSYFRIL